MTRHKQFTLVEILAVIIIIMILVGILLPTTNLVITKAERSRTRSAMKSVEMAVKQYESTYGHLPVVTTDGAIDDNGDYVIPHNTDANQRFISLLTDVDGGSSHDLGNARGVRFLEPQSAAAGSSVVNAKFMDSWGQQFKYKIDGNYDGSVDGSNLNGYSASDKLFTTIAIVSGGPDESHSSTADNVNSWESK